MRQNKMGANDGKDGCNKSKSIRFASKTLPFCTYFKLFIYFCLCNHPPPLHMPRALITYLLCMISLTIATARDSLGYKMLLMDTRSGLAENKVRAIVPLKDGGMAIITSANLQCFNGARFTTYPLTQGHSYLLANTHNSYRIQAKDAGDIYWRKDKQQLRAVDLQTMADVDSISGLFRQWGVADSIADFLVDNDGRRWMLSAKGTLYYQTDNSGAAHVEGLVINDLLTIASIKECLGDNETVIRIMPNTPAMVGEGMTAICDDTTFSQEDFDFAKGIFDAIGKTRVLPERLFDGVIAISSSSPAYVYMMIEAMADAGVREGLPRSYAYEMAAQSVLGSALMVLNSGTHPAALKDAVCSPGGTTIEAVAVLEKNGFRNAILEAMRACADKSREMSAQKA